MKRIYFVINFILLINVTLFCVSSFVEVNQMFAIGPGIELDFNDSIGSRLALGLHPLDIKSVTYGGVLFYKVPEKLDNFEYFIEAGVPIAYVDFLEGELDWDDTIDGPYAGWLFGPSIRAVFHMHWFIRLGVAYWVEWQEDSGFKNGTLPIVALGYDFN